MRAADFCLLEASRLRRLATGCTNPSLRVELLNRAAEFEDLASSPGDQQQRQDEILDTRRQAPTINWLVGIQREAAAGLSRFLRLRTRAAGKTHQRILERLCEGAVVR